MNLAQPNNGFPFQILYILLSNNGRITELLSRLTERKNW